MKTRCWACYGHGRVGTLQLDVRRVRGRVQLGPYQVQFIAGMLTSRTSEVERTCKWCDGVGHIPGLVPPA